MNKIKIITIRVPLDLLSRMVAYRETNGVSVTFQLCKGAELFLAANEKDYPAKS